MYDAIVIGARCAGASTAMLLGRQGHKVLLVDRAIIPSDIPHGHFIHRGGPQRLQKWGVLAQIADSGCPMVSNAVMATGGVPLVGQDLFMDGLPFGCGPRRQVLDGILVEEAAAAQVEIRDRFLVEAVLADGDRVTGIKGRDLRSGRRSTEQARIVVGADGRRSRLAKAVQAPMYEEVPSVSCYYFSYWIGVPGNALEVHVGRSNAVFAFPTNDDLLAVFVGWPVDRFHEVRTDVEMHFQQALAIAPELAGRIRAGRREERFYGTADVPNFFRKPYGPGWALVGDAGHHKDPYMALGIADALRDAELIADAVHTGLSGTTPLNDTLVGYEQQRNELSRPLYYENLARARFTPPPAEFVQIKAALLQNQDQQDINQFLKANLGLIPRERFFNPENISRIMGQATHKEMAKMPA